MRNATQKASVSGPAPNALAIRTSRIRPVIRDSSVNPLTVAADRSRLMDAFDYFGAMRIAPSRRMVSPLIISLVIMLLTSLA